jgi:hypothetical protein
VAATVTVSTNPADPTGNTLRFDVEGAPEGETIIWRFGDCTDHESDAGGIDHTYSDWGFFPVIAHIASSGQRLLVQGTVDAPTLITIDPSDGADADLPAQLQISAAAEGVDLTTCTKVTVGGLECSQLWVEDTGTVVCIMDANLDAGTYTVVCTTATGDVVQPFAFKQTDNRPWITGITPLSGAGNSTAVITGRNLAPVSGVFFSDGDPSGEDTWTGTASIQSQDNVSITVQTPGMSGKTWAWAYGTYDGHGRQSNWNVPFTFL